MKSRSSHALGAAVAVPLLALLVPGGTAAAAPASVALAGSFQSELGCTSDFNIACAQTALLYNSFDDVWRRSLAIPAGNWSYVGALDGSFANQVGRNATPGGANIPFSLAAGQTVNFYYDDKTHWLTDSISATIAVLAGSFQSELGCTSDFNPGCLRSWLQDPDGDGIYSFTTTLIPAGSYSTVVAINESFAQTYGLGGTPGGGNINFTAPGGGMPLTFLYNGATHLLQILPGNDPVPVPEPGALGLFGLGLAGLLLAQGLRRRPG